ncbi:Putative aliphatic sulfonates transport permease protein SsuC [Koleobacter methoxysyntrophicus]|uniref:Aliphatic sulfonates transport permease protein SsuC n=2 Tax=Koleobacter methoxysyntrophicus TaxID=2751313 RepID=A0A8A0RNL3_9FIRM|nr:ABC transporter permease [Koleobacter methoxysyntrophicus]QSQ09482.1 Putative aliphatic sulfonates transport permease protein SsuC [Koleobacter methoxysyntrophicus]
MNNLFADMGQDKGGSKEVIIRKKEQKKGRILSGNLMVKACSILSPFLFLVLWEVLSKSDVIDKRLFSTPSLILKTMIQLLATGELFYHVWISVFRIILGFLLGAVPGVILGLSMGLFPLVRSFLKPIVSAAFPIPKLALMPLILIIFGLGEASKVVTIALGVFFLVLINTMAGVMNIEQIYVDVARNFGAGKKEFYLTVALPGALPVIFAGFKIAMGTALLLIVAAELSAARAGIGWMIWRAYDMFDIEKMFSGLIIMSFLGFIFSYCLDLIEKWVIPWKNRE